MLAYGEIRRGIQLVTDYDFIHTAFVCMAEPCLDAILFYLRDGNDDDGAGQSVSKRVRKWLERIGILRNFLID